MGLSADQHSRIAQAYEKAAADHMVPAQYRQAFVRKAHWFRMVARITAKKEAVMGEKRAKPSAAAASTPNLDKADDRSKER